MHRTYREARRFETFLERYRYLALNGSVGEVTFGSDRYINQAFYRSVEWKSVRNQVILRDRGCDLGVEGYDIHDAVYIHHINPLTVQQIREGDPALFDLDNLISVTHRTHNAIHYGDESQLPRLVVERQPGDTKLW